MNLPKSLEKIGYKAFANCWDLETAHFSSAPNVDSTAFDYQTNSYLSQQHKVVLKVMPFDGFIFGCSTDIIKNELTKDVTKTMSLLDMEMSYQKKAVKVSLDISNILNQHQYGYTIYNSVNTFTYSYQLRGRECVCSVMLTI